MSDLQPDTRATLVETIFERWYGESPGLDVAAILADLRHYCDRHKLSFSEQDGRAHGFYLAEVFGRTA